MLQEMRQGTNNIFVYLAFGILIVVFTFYFGQGAEGCQPSKRAAAAKVNGDTLYNTDITIIFNRAASNRRDLSETELSELKQKSIEKLALLYFLSDKASAKGFEVGQEELAKYILDSNKNIDFRIYSKEGKFDMEIYKRYINNYLEVTTEDYEYFKAKELLVNKYLSSLENTVTVAPNEIDALNKLRSTKVNLEFIKFDATQLQAVLGFTDAEVAAYADKSSEAVKKYFDDNKAEFGTPKRVRVRRLIVNNPPDKSADDVKKKATDKWAAAKDRVVTKKEDFAAVAKELSDDYGYKDKGGDMGWSKLEDMDQAMAKVVDAMKLGEVKEYKAPFGNFLLKLEEMEAAVEKSLDDVKLEIARKLLVKEAGDEKVVKLADEVLKRATADGSKTLDDILTALKPKTETAKEEAKADIGGDKAPDVDKTEGKTEPEVELKKTPWDVLKVATTGSFARTPRQTYKFDQETKQFAPVQLAWSDIQNIGDDKALAMAVFGLKAEAPVYPKVYKSEGAHFVVRLKERTDPTDDDLTKSRPAVERELRQQQMAALLGPWQSLFYNPSANIKDVSPWINRVFEDAKKSGKVDLMLGVFAPPEAPVEPSVTEGEETGEEAKDGKSNDAKAADEKKPGAEK
jgi:peptidyl-prolyl cis-trans isomerase D